MLYSFFKSNLCTHIVYRYKYIISEDIHPAIDLQELYKNL